MTIRSTDLMALNKFIFRIEMILLLLTMNTNLQKICRYWNTEMFLWLSFVKADINCKHSYKYYYLYIYVNWIFDGTKIAVSSRGKQSKGRYQTGGTTTINWGGWKYCTLSNSSVDIGCWKSTTIIGRKHNGTSHNITFVTAYLLLK